MTDKLERRKAAEIRGRRSETLAAIFLVCKFYRIIGRRVKTQLGELDLVAVSPSGVVCFIEVKARGLENDAVAAVTLRQRARITRAAALYLAARPGLRHKAVRFDAMLVTPRRLPTHIRDAWRPEF